MTEFVDCDSDIELYEMSAENSEKTLLVNTIDRDKISYSSADDSVNVGNEPGHRKVVQHQKKETKLSGFLLVLSFFAAIGGFLFGYDTGVVSGAMLLLKTNFDLSSFSEEVIVSVTIGSAAVFSICSGVLNEYLGRKLTIIIGSFVFTAGAIVLAVAQNIAMLISGRAIVGIGIGIASMTVPTYIAECAPSELRGRLVTINNLFITGGQFIASVLDGAFSYDKINGWRYMLGLAGVPSAIQFVGFFFLPESPRWLISKGKEVEARKVLCKIRGHSNVEEELQEIIQKFEEERESTNNKAEEYIIVRVVKTPPVRRALILGSFLQIFQQLSGINTVMYYSATIIQMTGVRSQSTAIWLAAVTAFVNFIFTLVGVWLVDRIGRRKLILSSLAGVLFSLVVLAVGFQVTALNSPPVTTFESSSNNSECFQYRSCESCTDSLQCGFCYIEKSTYSAENGSCLPYTDPSMSSEGRCNSTKLQINLVWAENYCPSPYSILGLIGLIIYLMAFAPGMGPMPWTINSEIYPLWARSTCTAISTSFNWIFNLTVSLSFLTLTEQITKYGTYWLFVGIVIIGFIIIYAALPETKGKKLEEVQALFEKGWCSDSHYDQLKICNETIIDAN
ncbi:SLC2A13 [Mytilus coruscus]|uniref:SLC2A13 n=1 Tax=Mytilus coruscus TaxID=42192 RepID=A0A6J8EI48_MYTCO|nr:SLC2A13 [Mytilus coruscus]